MDPTKTQRWQEQDFAEPIAQASTDFTKTRIWHAQELGLTPARGEMPVQTTTLPGLAPARPARASVPPPPPPHPARRISSPGLLAATRIMPIERLFPSAMHVSTAPPTLRMQAQAPASPWRTLKRVGVHVLLATLTVLAVAAWKLPRAPARARLMPPAAESQDANDVHDAPDVAKQKAGERATVDPPAAATQIAPLPAAAAAATVQRAGGKSKAPPLERRAIELVISGDYASAEQAYLALARERPDNTAFREAARILSGRRRQK